MYTKKPTIPEDVIERAYRGKCTKEDALLLLEGNPFELFELANDLRASTVGDAVSYVVNRNIYITNKCVGNCGFCAYRTEKGYILSVEEILEKAGEARKAGAVEVCIQGGYIPEADIEFYLEIIESVKAEFPDLCIHALSPMEVNYAAGLSGMSVEEALHRLKKSGLDSLTGTSAEILSDRVRKIICPGKINTQQWIDTITAAHKAGISTNSTIMYGHVETLEERLDHVFIIREIQKETGGFTELIPMAFLPYNNPIGEKMIASGKFSTTGLEDLQLIAISRVILHTYVKNIQATWVKLGKKLAQVALQCGANDLGGTLMEDQISTASGGSNGEYVSPAEFEWMIKGAGRTPMQRDTLYRKVEPVIANRVEPLPGLGKTKIGSRD
ncbi:7,8-didemethyl-8-hydroxy-5-deazariboflavin synthase subunit 2 [Methanosarcina barkeri str. Wiesmoor]|uniref:5-amino-6-(D-ribitylamino)uracil--L-tyrosine 4-hydroxyphenyl transferase 2 n=2 Tax=Methanosarcina barkeri TaxID=2208 RepID=COFH2_METBF|nr:5-amino-6-(D-ribitylamino)uracil--L-tyrosine 4-hydroxyphenyl transferase CofH [Methanosarcina barkeri]Q466A2.1 RecName: Full=5-amino-6-(D-ribitylamino)uracil--L-tyrosine 4-hydroxyphenyl transferase 2; AltName: Full=FO synthase subunit 2 2 [Methanosarcina barkeri str. Fusaro]AKB50570.1 7,8-didemethyl-8-hydroxy-5-deazariboflavin synthase subunit 2 [Methanosarcina barkeri str. Wiesmoor]